MADCIYCREKIIDNAKFCKHCNHYQKTWKNWIPHIGGAIALIVFLGSIGGYVIRPVRDAYKKFLWRDEIEVISFNSKWGITIKNSGDGEVFIESATYRHKGKKYYSGGKRIRTAAKRGEFTSYRFKSSISGEAIKHGQKFDENDVIPVFCSENDAEYRIFKSSLKEKLFTIPCEAELNYYSLVKRGIRRVKIPCVGYLFKKETTDTLNTPNTKNRVTY